MNEKFNAIVQGRQLIFIAGISTKWWRCSYHFFFPIQTPPLRHFWIKLLFHCYESLDTYQTPLRYMNIIVVLYIHIFLCIICSVRAHMHAARTQTHTDTQLREHNFGIRPGRAKIRIKYHLCRSWCRYYSPEFFCSNILYTYIRAVFPAIVVNLRRMPLHAELTALFIVTHAIAGQQRKS